MRFAKPRTAARDGRSNRPIDAGHEGGKHRVGHWPSQGDMSPSTRDVRHPCGRKSHHPREKNRATFCLLSPRHRRYNLSLLCIRRGLFCGGTTRLQDCFSRSLPARSPVGVPRVCPFVARLLRPPCEAVRIVRRALKTSALRLFAAMPVPAVRTAGFASSS